MSNYCLIAKGISYSQIRPGQTESAANLYDSTATIEQIKEHDRVYLATCPPKEPE